jgi:hypothetical protein
MSHHDTRRTLLFVSLTNDRRTHIVSLSNNRGTTYIVSPHDMLKKLEHKSAEQMFDFWVRTRGDARISDISL